MKFYLGILALLGIMLRMAIAEDGHDEVLNVLSFDEVDPADIPDESSLESLVRVNRQEAKRCLGCKRIRTYTKKGGNYDNLLKSAQSQDYTNSGRQRPSFLGRKKRSSGDIELEWAIDEAHGLVHSLELRDAEEDFLVESELDGDHQNKSKRHLFAPRKTYKHNLPPPPSYNVHQSSSYSNLPKKYVVVPPPGKAPAKSIQPGQPGGGMYPKGNRFAAALAPRGSTPVAVFPPYVGYQHYPADCVVYSEPSPFDHHDKPSYERSSSYDKPTYGPTETVYIQRTFGLRCMVIISDDSCEIGTECDMYGKPLSNSTTHYSPPHDNGYGRPKRQTGQTEISPDIKLTERLQSVGGNCP